jgi:hypothetical protein
VGTNVYRLTQSPEKGFDPLERRSSRMPPRPPRYLRFPLDQVVAATRARGRTPSPTPPLNQARHQALRYVSSLSLCD